MQSPRLLTKLCAVKKIQLWGNCLFFLKFSEHTEQWLMVKLSSFSLNWFLVIFMEQNLFGTLKKCRNIFMLVPLLHSIVHYLLTSFFHVCSWSAVPVGSCAHDIKGFLGVKKPLCKRTNCCLVSENTLEKTLARNLLKEREKSRSSWRNIWAAVECKEWS